MARVAVNLRGVAADEIPRGSTLVTPRRWRSVGTLDVRVDGRTDALPEQVMVDVPTIITATVRETNGQSGGTTASTTGVETQSEKYSAGLPETLPAHQRPLPFLYQTTGVETRFTNWLDPDPRSRRVQHFHRPETLAAWLGEFPSTLRKRFC